MEDFLSLWNMISSEMAGETSIIIRITTVLILLVKLEIKNIGRFYRMKLGIKD